MFVMKKKSQLKKISKKMLSLPMLILTFSFLMLSMPITRLQADARGKAIAKKMIDREDGKSRYEKSILASCRFQEKGGKKSCISKPRVKIFEALSKDIGAGLKDTISLNLILDPPAERGTAFLQKDYDQEGKDSEQWVYLPALKKLKRVVSESYNSPKTGTLFGSEISYEDIEKVHLQDYNYKYISEENYDGRSVYVLEARPTQRRAPKSSYRLSKFWIDKATYIILKAEMFDRQNRLYKSMFSQGLIQRKGVWLARRMIIVNYRNGRMSMMRSDKIAVNPRISSGLFENRALEDASYRERAMQSIRKAAY